MSSVNPERWHRVEELYNAALELAVDERMQFLKDACRDDPTLYQEIESLLSYEERDEQFINRPAFEVVAELMADEKVRLFEPDKRVGKTISHFRVLERLGQGGMGIVFRAEDIHLGRQVALKFLPEETTDSQALQRLQREARAASSLNHPNICAIHEIGEHEGEFFIAMELLEGQSLDHRIGGHSLPLEECLTIGIQITEGLHAAHQKGIIHRDIKPANIFVTSQGQAKILDFGLAKLASAVTVAGNELEQDPHDGRRAGAESVPVSTPDLLLSRTGVAMGTAGYMSPEQVRGEKLDARTDLFSLGLVLFEMATGKRAFHGDTGPELHDAILNQTPTSARKLNPKVPAKLDEIIRKSLEKEREQRYQSAAELRTDLEILTRDILPQAVSFRWWAAPVVAIALVLVAAVFWYTKRPPAIVPDLRLRQLTFNSNENPVTSGSVSPDGKYLAYTDHNGMYIQSIDTGAIRAVPWPEGLNSQNAEWEVVEAAWFPDSARFIANAHPAFQSFDYLRSDSTSIWIVSAQGGAPRKLRDKGMAWSVSQDSSLIAYGRNRGKFGGDREIWLMTPSGEDERKALDTDESSGVGVFQWAPHGQRFLYDRFDEHGETKFTADLNGGPPTLLFPPSENGKMNDLLWLPDGRLLYPIRESQGYLTCNFWTRRLDPHTGQLLEKPTRLTNWPGSCLDSISATADGKRLVLLKITERMTSYVADLAAGGTHLLHLRHFPETESSEGIAEWTPDSKELIVVSNRANDYFGMYRQPLNEEAAIPLDTKEYGRNPAVTPDGKWILYLGYGRNEQGWWEAKPRPLLRVPINGGPAVTLFTAGPGTFSVTCARPPAELCAIGESSENGREWVITRLDPLTGRGPELARLAVDSNALPWSGQLSPDGTRIALAGNPKDSIHILSLQRRSTQEVKVKGWSHWYKPAWAADGRGLYVSASSQSRKVILYVDLQGNERVVWEGANATQGTLALPSPDGRHLAIQTMMDNNNMWMMENF